MDSKSDNSSIKSNNSKKNKSKKSINSKILNSISTKTKGYTKFENSEEDDVVIGVQECNSVNTNLPSYVSQLSSSTINSLDHQHKIHQNGHQSKDNLEITNSQSNSNQNCLNNSNDHDNIEISQINDQEVQQPNRMFSALKGILLAFLSSIFFSLTTVIVKDLKTIDAGQMAVFRFTGMLLFVFPIVLDSKENIFGPWNLRHWLLLRGLASATSLYLRYNTLSYLSLSNSTVIALSMPVFVCILGRIFLKEAFGLFHVIALGITLIGIVFISNLEAILEGKEKGTKKHNDIYGLISGLCGTLIGSTGYIVVRKVKSLNYSVILFNFAWVAVLETTTLTYTAYDGIKLPKSNIVPWMIMGLGICSFYGQMLLTRALQAEEAALVSVTRSASEVFFAFLFQIVIFRNIPTLYNIIGAICIVSSVLLISVRKYVTGLSDQHLAKRIFWFTLI